MQSTVTKPDIEFLKRFENIYGASRANFPKYGKDGLVAAMYDIPLAMISRLARRALAKDDAGTAIRLDNQHKPYCKRCDTALSPDEKYCHGCGYLIKWTEIKLADDDEYWEDLLREATERDDEDDDEDATGDIADIVNDSVPVASDVDKDKPTKTKAVKTKRPVKPPVKTKKGGRPVVR